MIEAKSAGDATNTNKRRKEEAQKFRQLKERYGDAVKFLLYLCGYFEPGYLGYEAAEGIDWVWEHRTSDFQSLFVPETKKKPRKHKGDPGRIHGGETQGRKTIAPTPRNQADARKSAEERNRLGQFSTPFPVACQIVARALKAIPHDSPLIFLEPALGRVCSSVHCSAMHGERTIASAIGCEIDPAYGDIAMSFGTLPVFKLSLATSSGLPPIRAISASFPSCVRILPTSDITIFRLTRRRDFSLW